MLSPARYPIKTRFPQGSSITPASGGPLNKFSSARKARSASSGSPSFDSRRVQWTSSPVHGSRPAESHRGSCPGTSAADRKNQPDLNRSLRPRARSPRHQLNQLLHAARLDDREPRKRHLRIGKRLPRGWLRIHADARPRTHRRNPTPTTCNPSRIATDIAAVCCSRWNTRYDTRCGGPSDPLFWISTRRSRTAGDAVASAARMAGSTAGPAWISIHSARFAATGSPPRAATTGAGSAATRSHS